MLTFSHHNPTYCRSGLALLLLQLALFVWALPPFQMGIWVQTEPLVFLLLAFASLSAAWIGYGMVRGLVTLQTPLHPVWIAWLAWVGWQVFTTLCATTPWRSWFGPPQTGDGTALQIALFLAALHSLLLWQVEKFRRVITLTATISLAIQATLHLFYYRTPDYTYIPDRWAPAQWPEYLAFTAGYTWLFLSAAGYIRTRLRYAALVAGMCAVLFVSWNESAVPFYLLAMLATAIACWLPLPARIRAFLQPAKAWRIAAIICCVIPMSMVALAEMLPGIDPGENPGTVTRLLTEKDNGIGARMVLNQVAVSTLSHEPGRLFIGDGWGRFNDDLFKYALVDGVYVFKNAERKPNWFLVDGNSYHVHSQPLEALLSLGLAGMLLWYALPMLVLWYLPERLFWSCAPMLVAWVALSHLWMQLPQCLPYQALAFAVLISSFAQQTREVFVRKRTYAATCAGLVIMMSWSACAQWRAMVYGETLQSGLRGGMFTDYTEEWLAEDFARGGDRWLASAAFYSKQASSAAARREADGNTMGWYGYLLHTARTAAADPSVGASVSAMQLRLQYYLFGGFDDPVFDTLRHEEARDFESAVMRLIHKAPLRDDYTTFFLLNLAGYTKDDIERQKKILTRMLLVAPEHRGAGWLLGFILSKTEGREEEGLTMLKKAISMHVDTILPLTSADLEPYQ